jgi:hypothetical protein
LCEVPANPGKGNDPENTQKKFSVFTGKFHPERHAVVLCKMNDEPVTKEVKLLPKIHIGLNPEFQQLVGKQNKKNEDKWQSHGEELGV